MSRRELEAALGTDEFSLEGLKVSSCSHKTPPIKQQHTNNNNTQTRVVGDVELIWDPRSIGVVAPKSTNKKRTVTVKGSKRDRLDELRRKKSMIDKHTSDGAKVVLVVVL